MGIFKNSRSGTSGLEISKEIPCAKMHTRGFDPIHRAMMLLQSGEVIRVERSVLTYSAIKGRVTTAKRLGGNPKLRCYESFDGDFIVLIDNGITTREEWVEKYKIAKE